MIVIYMVKLSLKRFELELISAQIRTTYNQMGPIIQPTAGRILLKIYKADPGSVLKDFLVKTGLIKKRKAAKKAKK